ncbi:hypothetical protein [Streptomyces sp. TR06-5]|uniref:hypothetical protein n=1 Tax=unclassified Streptomyces TaxID=2593676 RepID=UPI0039A0297A
MSALHTTTTQLLPLAKELNDATVSPGVLGFIVFAVMALGVWMLMKSMNRHMNRVHFTESPAPEPGASAERQPEDA